MKAQEVLSGFGLKLKRHRAESQGNSPHWLSGQFSGRGRQAPPSRLSTSERAVGVLIFLVVCLLGITLTAYVVKSKIQSAAQVDKHELAQSAGKYSNALKRLLDLYVTSTTDLAAFATASDTITGHSFERYVQASRPFERLPGLRAVGYLPVVHKNEQDQFEKRMREEYPGFRVWGQRLAEDVWYPLAYAVNPADPARKHTLRGFDYATIVEREEAIAKAVRTGKPQATYLHSAVMDPANSGLVLLFAPVFHEESFTAVPSVRPNVKGVVFSVLLVEEIFRAFDHGTLTAAFDLEAFENVVDRSTLLYATEAKVRAISKDGEPALIRSETLDVAGVQWTVHFYERSPVSVLSMLHAQGATLLAGLLASLLSGYVAWRLWRHHRAVFLAASGAEHFASFINNHPFAVFSLDLQRRFIAVNTHAEQELGVPGEQLLGHPVEQFLAEETRASTCGYFEQALQGQAVSFHLKAVAADGRQSDLSIVLVPMTTDGVVTSVLGIAKNITARKLAEQDLHRERQTLQLVLHTIPQMVFWKTADGVYQGANRRMLEFAGLQTVDEIVGKTDRDMPWRAHADQHIQEDAEIVCGRTSVCRQEAIETAHEEQRWLEFNKVPLLGMDGQVECVLGMVQDVTERKGAEVELFMRANYDALTGVANRSYFYHQLDKVLIRQTRQPQPLALMYFDIDYFKQINDTHGHDIGDRVLAEFAGRVLNVIRSTEMLARLGGDEFVLLVEQAGTEASLRTLAERLLAAMRAPFLVQGKSLNARTSVGIAVYEAGMSVDGWVKKADDALYEAKRRGRDCYWFAPPEGSGIAHAVGGKNPLNIRTPG